jgi:Xaa-Pro aminopeptidase
MAERTFPQEEYEERWRRVHAEMRRRGLGAAIVWGRSNQTYDRCGDVLYLTNFYAPEVPADSPVRHAWGTYAVILVPGETPELVTDPADDRTAHLGTPRVSRSADVIAGVAERLKARGISGPVAVAGTDVLAWKYARELEAATRGIDWEPADDLVKSVRRIKSPRELDLIREGGAVAGRALDCLMKELVAGSAERDAVAEAARVLYRGGGQGSYISVNHGATIAHWCREPFIGRSIDSPRPGDLVRGWMDCHFKGYWLDPGRTAVAGGKPTREQRQLLEDCARIVEGLAAATRPGASVREISETGNRLVREAGGSLPGGSYVHGIGLHWEPPFIGADPESPDERIRAGMAMGAEYFLSREGVGTVGIEQNFLVLAERNEDLIGLPMIGW